MPTETARHPEVLLLASRYDLTCDYVVSCLRSRSIEYLRLNSEDLSEAEVRLDPVRRHLDVSLAGLCFAVTPSTLKSVLFRRPVYLRDYGDDHRTPDERFSRLQWAAFMRNLLLFDDARWMNHPAATYEAEHKAVQLAVAARLGFDVPETCITNAPDATSVPGFPDLVAVKGLDTVLLRADGQEMFGFTTFERPNELESDAWRFAPGTFQQALRSKLDIRVTVVEERVFAASITAMGEGIVGDWRAHKEHVEYESYSLPVEVARLCAQLTRTLGLRFGAIDLALSDGRYYFLEINPTGEWAWLVDTARLPIDEAIADALAS